MRNKIIVALIAVLWSPSWAADSMTPEERAFVDGCYQNVHAKILSAATAEKCLEGLNANNAYLLKGLQYEDADLAAGLVAYNSALVDLKKMLEAYRGLQLARMLNRVLDAYPCPLCDMRLGPDPDLILPWADVNTKMDTASLAYSIKSWDTLKWVGPELTKEYGYDKDGWSRVLPVQRYETLSKWSRKETDKVITYPLESRSNVARHVDMLKTWLIMPGDEVYVKKLNDFMNAKEKPGTGSKEKSARLEGRADNMRSAADKMAAMNSGSVSEQRQYMDRTFDNAGVYAAAAAGTANTGAGGASGPRKSVPITPEQAKILSEKMLTMQNGKATGYLVNDLRGTKAGDHVIGFYEGQGYSKTGGNKLDFAFGKEDKGILGMWRSDQGTIRVNMDIVDKYTAEHAITPERLLASEHHMRNFATYIGPTFVHEAVHQEQSAREAEADVTYQSYGKLRWAPYHMEKEVEAFATEGAFMSEKYKKNGRAYLSRLYPWDWCRAERFLEGGPDEIRRVEHAHAVYSDVNTLNGASAKEMRNAIEANEELSRLEAKRRNAPMTMTEQDSMELARYRGLVDKQFKWYAGAYRQSKEDEVRFMRWRQELDPNGETLKSLRTQVPGSL